MDVDGVLTDGRMVLSERGDELKLFDTRDGVAVALARRAGFRTAIVTGETTTIAKARKWVSRSGESPVLSSGNINSQPGRR